MTDAQIDARFIVEVRHVREVSLAGLADLDDWQKRLQPQALFPFATDDRVEVLITAAVLRWMGRRTTELTISLPVMEQPGASVPDGMLLMQAFNSSRLFAWIERTFFSTPYDLGHIQLDDRVPARISLSDQSGTMIDLRQAPGAVLQHSQDEDWQDRIYIPRRGNDRHETGKYFVARLAGFTEVYAADATTVALVPRSQWPALQWLLDSNWTPTAWRIRHDAVHARSRTFTQS